MRKLLLFFLLVSGACQGQTILNRQVTLTRQSGTVGEFLNDLDEFPGITLSYSSGVIDLSRKVQVSGQEKTVEDFLKTILKAQPVKYTEQSGKIFLLAEEPIKKKFTVSGYVADSKSGERLIGTSLYAVKKGLGTTSNTYGFFSLTLEEDSIELLVSHSGYITQSLILNLQQDIVLTLLLEQRIVVNEMVVINSESKTNSQTRTLPGKINVSSSFIKSMPALLGESDVLKTLQLLPGIQAGNEGTSGLNVRGGGADQNLVLLDGVPVYNASHAFGFFSIFNADAVHNVEVLKSGFPASYGGRLSSVVDVQLKEGDKYEFHGEGGIGMVFSRLTLEGPLKKGASSFLVSARRTYADLILRPIIKRNEPTTTLNTFFSDIIAKTNFSLGKSNHLYFSFYTGKDKYASEDEHPYQQDYSYQKSGYGFSWGNITAMARWNHVFSKKLFSNLTFNFSRFRFNADESNEYRQTGELFNREFRQWYFSSIQDLNVKYDLDFLPAPNHFVKLGFAATIHQYHPGVRRVFQKDSTIRIDRRIDNYSLLTGEYDLYAEDDIRFSARMKANIGVRLTGFSIPGRFYLSIQPRINWLYKLNNKWSLKASAVKMNQYIHLLTNSNMGLPTDLWVPVTRRVPPQVSYQFSGGMAYNSHDKSLELSAELYYKHLKNVIEYSEGSGFTNSFLNWEDIVELGKGKTYGMEWLLQKRKGKLTGLAGYTLGWSRRKFEHINNGKTFPYKYDKRHELKMGLAWKPSARFELSGDWIFSTGNAISLPVAWYRDPYTGRNIDIYGDRNDFRMPIYHRLDLALKMMKQKKRHMRTWMLGIYNVYNKLNPFYLYKFSRSLGPNMQETEFVQVSLFPILPFVSYQFKF